MTVRISVHHELIFVLRSLRRRAGFTALAAATMALGIGAATAEFSTIDALLFRPKPGIAEPRALVAIREYNEHERAFTAVSFPNYRHYREHARCFTDIAAWTVTQAYIGSPKPRQFIAALVTANYFNVLGVHLAAGRGFTGDEDSGPGKHPVVIISHAFWTTRLNADPNVIGKIIALDRTSFTVVGIAPPRFRGVELFDQIDVWTPVSMFATFQPGLAQSNLLADASRHQFVLLGRLAPGVHRAQAQVELDLLASRRDPVTLHREGKKRVLVDDHTEMEPDFRRDLTRLAALQFTAVVLLLLIATSNVANMLLSRAAESGKDIAVRLALGAGRVRVIRQVLLESLTIAFVGASGGVLFGWWLIELTKYLLPPGLPPDLIALTPSRFLVLAAATALVAGLLSGLAPARQTQVSDLWTQMKSGVSGGASRRFSRMRRALIVGQIALCVTLLIASALLLQTLRNSYRAELGYRTDNLLLSSANLGMQGYTRTRAVAFSREVLTQIEAVSGVRSATIAASAPLAFFNWTEDVEADGRRLTVGKNVVAANYFRALEIPLIAGRGFTAQDREGVPEVAIVNQALAERLWPSQSAIGRRLHLSTASGPPVPIEVVGVSRNAVHGELNQGWQPWLYLPLTQHPQDELVLHVRTAPGVAIGSALMAAVNSLDPDLLMESFKPFAEHFREILIFRRTASSCVGLYGTMALLMAATGLFGVISYAAAQRRREIGIRMALGADRSQVVRMFYREGVLLAAAGVLLGAAISYPVNQSLRGFLYGVLPWDFRTHALVALVIVTVALVASTAPARRAAKLDPATVLRDE